MHCLMILYVAARVRACMHVGRYEAVYRDVKPENVLLNQVTGKV